MTSRQHDEEQIFHIAREIPNLDARAGYIDQICAGDQALRERVEGLLDVHEKEQSFLKSNGAVEPTVDQPSITESPGQEIGRYKLLQKIGEGGFGVVYMAEQSRPVRRKVALKIIKPGMDTNAVIARFEAERQALALMDHPNISRVLDGGTTESGRPYFVMELVKGVPITEYCDKNQLNARDRLDLFLTVCQAVQHAHQKGLIHRDLKPSNILVTLHDGQPMIKVIDFGVAKAINQQLTEKTLFTAFGQMVGTPQYMSPEQAEMSGLDVDTRSDIYSLGVLLYELLTGTTPLESERLKTAGYIEMQRLIREEDPPKPSTRLSSSGKDLTVIAKHRSLSPEQLQKAIRGDLDWIVMKALEKDRARRYETPASFAEDVVRYLDDKPVEACPPSSAYRLRKYLRRNRAMITAASFVALALVAATVTSSRFAWKTNVEKRRAEQINEALKVQLIERGVQEALRGDDERLSQTIAMSRDLIGSSWQLTLQGTAALHQGNNEDAQRLLRKAEDTDPDNVAAKSMLSIAYYHEGQLEDWESLIADFEQWRPRPEFKELDRLFLAYARLYVNFGEAVGEFEGILANRPDWILAHALLSIAYAESGQDSGDKKLVELALKKIDVTRNILGDNTFVLAVALFVHEVAVRMEVGDVGRLTLESRVLVERLEPYTDYKVPVLMIADFYDRQGQRSTAMESWSNLLHNGESFFRSRAMAEYHREEKDDDVIGLRPTDPEASIARAYVLAGYREHRDEALDIFRREAAKSTTWRIRYKLMQLGLLLKKLDLVKQQSESWFGTEHGSERDVDSDLHKRLISFVAFGTPIPKSETSAAYERLATSYVHALLAYAGNDLAGALELLEECENSQGQCTEKHWARAFRLRWAE